MKDPWLVKQRKLSEELARGVRTALSAAVRLKEMETERPDGVTFYRTADFEAALADAKKMEVLLSKWLELAVDEGDERVGIRRKP